MSKLLKSLAIAAAISTGAASAASAAVTEVFNWSGCGGAGFASCATVVANYDDVAKTLVFTVDNTNPAAGWTANFSAVGWSGLGGTFSGTGHSAVGDGSWQAFSSSVSSIGAAGFSAAAPPSSNGIGAGESTTFTIQFATAPSFTSFTFRLHEIGVGTFYSDQGLVCNNSNKLDVTNTGGVYTTNSADPQYDAECFTDPGDPNTAVPEPATMILLASGLAGMAGVQIRRRRKS